MRRNETSGCLQVDIPRRQVKLSASTRNVSIAVEHSKTLAELFETHYKQLCHKAAAYLKLEPPDAQLEPQELVHEAFIRLQNLNVRNYEDSHFVFCVLHVMRNILIDRSRWRRAQKRGGMLRRVYLDGI